MFTISTVVMISQVDIFVKTGQTVHFKCVSFIVHQLHLNEAALKNRVRHHFPPNRLGKIKN